ncbi:hypothetical protein KIS4809_3041 [Bacillus sp. ZZV12-4809]|nr:hypothetical protein KIS4809_3041 [Bacillus sp. ZZV12-4809]
MRKLLTQKAEKQRNPGHLLTQKAKKQRIESEPGATSDTKREKGEVGVRTWFTF